MGQAVLIAMLALGHGLAVVLVGYWFARWARESAEHARDLAVRQERLGHDLQDREEAIDRLHDECERQAQALVVARELAERATARLAATGDAAAIVDALNDELRELARLSELPAGPGREGGDGAGPVHGAAAPADDEPSPGADTES